MESTGCVGVRARVAEEAERGDQVARRSTLSEGARAKELKAISLFSGAGGMDIGFDRASFRVLAAVELDPSCCDTLRANLDKTIVLNEDISVLSGDALLQKVGLKRGELDLLFGGPPCQSFSLAGNRKGLGDPRGQLVGHFARLVHEIAPKAFVMENVKGMANWSNGKALDFVLNQLREPVEVDGNLVEYHCSMAVLNAADFGVPQYRERLFIVGNRLGRSFKFPTPTHAAPHKIAESNLQPHIAVGAAIANLPPPGLPSAVAERVSRTIKGRIDKHGY